MEENKIKVVNITVPITKSALTLRTIGDWHYGVRGVDLKEGERVIMREQDQHRGNQFELYTGDLPENNLTSSVGHGYDVEIRDPDIQVKSCTATLKKLQENLYGVKDISKLKVSASSVLSAGVIGNHEYRSRNASGTWLNEQMYGPSKILDMGISGLINLKITNAKLKMEKTYRIFVAHRPNNSNATSIETILRACKKKKGDISADLYVFGHYHRRVIYPDGVYDQNGNFKKVLFVVNPSPILYVEYADWAGFSPLDSAWYCNVYLPLDGYPYGKV